MKKLFTLFISTFLFYSVAFAQANCSAPSTGFTPINDLGAGTFTNAWGTVWTGGLYLNGSNFMPSAHKSAGMQIAKSVVPLDASGNVDSTNGKMVWLSIGMSNTTAETQQFIPLANAYANKNPKLTLVDGAVGGASVDKISSPWLPQYATYWNTVATRLSNAGVTANQVQVIWFKEANPAGTMTIQQYYDSLLVQFTRCMHEIKTRFPNVKLCYMASRISARYASSTLNPEPFSYYTGWAIREIIQRQINGDTALAYSGNNIRSPFLSWGIYMWSDGSVPQASNPNIFITCPADLANDGTHPSAVGAAKVANWLLTFYQNDSLSCPWFFNTPQAFCGATGVDETASAASAVRVYPNPFSTSTIFQTANFFTNATLTVYNLYGQPVKQIKNFSGQTVTLSRDNLPGGLYFIHLTEDNKIITADKLVITD